MRKKKAYEKYNLQNERKITHKYLDYIYSTPEKK